LRVWGSRVEGLGVEGRGFGGRGSRVWGLHREGIGVAVLRHHAGLAIRVGAECDRLQGVRGWG
jgi:hypothetical protein